MIQVAVYIRFLALRGVRLEANGSQLRVTAPKGALTAELRDELVSRKADLLAFLRAEEKARYLNGLFREYGVRGLPARITAETVLHGERNHGRTR